MGVEDSVDGRIPSEDFLQRDASFRDSGRWPPDDLARPIEDFEDGLSDEEFSKDYSSDDDQT